MFAHPSGRALGITERGSPFLPKRGAAFVALAAAALLMQGCAAAPRQPIAGPDPSDAHVAVPKARYQPAITGASGLQPVAPLGWREQNEGVAPSQTR